MDYYRSIIVVGCRVLIVVIEAGLCDYRTEFRDSEKERERDKLYPCTYIYTHEWSTHTHTLIIKTYNKIKQKSLEQIEIMRDS